MIDVYQFIHKSKQWIYSKGLTFLIGLVLGLVAANWLWMRVSQNSTEIKSVSSEHAIIHDAQTQTLPRIASTEPPKIPRHVIPGKPIRVQDVRLKTPSGEVVNLEIVTSAEKKSERVTVQATGATVERGQDRVFPVAAPRPWRWSASLVGMVGPDGARPGLMVQRASGPWVLSGGVLVSPSGVPDHFFLAAGVRW